MMSERDFNLREDGLSARRQPRFFMTRHRAAIIVTLGYIIMALAVRMFLHYLEWMQGYFDNRGAQVSWLIGGLMAILYARALFNIYHRTGLPAPVE